MPLTKHWRDAVLAATYNPAGPGCREGNVMSLFFNTTLPTNPPSLAQQCAMDPPPRGFIARQTSRRPAEMLISGSPGDSAVHSGSQTP
ncbi:hypothetical protein KCP75_07365 [Salmonella enterica subsp. enterica]|nr:hypothetical protein KCP75_07365 [Salmonella enterica subsp. enterica]